MKLYGVASLLLTTLFLVNVECKITFPQMKWMAAKFIAPCMKKSGASEEHFQRARVGNFVEDQNFACFHKCIFQSMNILKNDRIQEKVLTKKINAMVVPGLVPILNGLVHDCMPAASDKDSCMAVLHFVSCWYHKNPKYYLFG